MTDAAYLFQQNVRERKSSSRGARAKKNGSKSRSCKLSTDYMTPAQIKKRNGDVKVYQLKKPMNWETFKAMPHDLQSEYISFLLSKKGRIADMLEMFGCEKGAWFSYMNRNHKGEFSFPKGRRVADPAWLDWITTPDVGAIQEEQSLVPAPKQVPTEIKAPVCAEPFGGNLSFTGRPEEVFTAVMKMLDWKKDYEITVTFRRS